MVPPRLRLVFGLVIVGLLVGVPLKYLAYVNHRYRNFRIVDEGVLYRSAQLPVAGLQRLVHDYRFRAVVCLRLGDDPVDQAEELFCRENGVRYVRIPPRNWGPINGIVPAEEGLARFCEVMDDPTNYPVLVHCFAGTHRTGAYVAVYRMEYQGWDNERALKELRKNGYVTLDGDRDVLEFMQSYQPGRAKRPAIMPVSQEKRP